MEPAISNNMTRIVMLVSVEEPDPEFPRAAFEFRCGFIHKLKNN